MSDQVRAEAALVANNAARPQPGVQLCALSELNDPASKAFEFWEGEALFIGFVVRRGDEVHGFVDYCPHAGWRLSVRDSDLKTISAAISPEVASGRREGRAPFAELMQTRF